MTGSPRTTPAGIRHWVRVASGVTGVWCAFVAVHVALILVASRNEPALYGDPALYGYWISQGLDNGVWPVLDDDWVYPLGALVPMTLPAMLGTGTGPDYASYRVAYELLVCVLNGLALGSLLHAGRGRTVGAWWWLGFLLLLGPISLVRLDGASAALTMIALTQLVPSARRPDGRVGLASALATFGAWIKIAPGALFLALLVVVERPWRRAVLPAVVVTAGLVLPALLAGAGSRVFSFLGAQDGRGLQSESGGATPFSVARLWSDAYSIEYNRRIKTWEIIGPGTANTGRVLDVLLVVAVLATAFVTWRAARGVRAALPAEEDRRMPLLELVLFATTALTVLLFVFNKVGSPQFVAWFGPPVAVALTVFGLGGAGGSDVVGAGGGGSRRARRRAWAVLAVALPVVAYLTQWLFPGGYGNFIDGVPLDIVVEATRNVALVVLGAWLVVVLARWRVGPAAPGVPAGPGSRDTPTAPTPPSPPVAPTPRGRCSRAVGWVPNTP